MIIKNNTILQKRYLIVRLLGQGGFGAVYEAKDQRLGHRVALKQLMLSGQHVQKAFEREARILARLEHPALPKVTDFFSDRNGYFLVMSDDLQRRLARQSVPFLVELVLEWADQVLDALEYLHKQQPPVIHRDIKPANIKLSPEGKIYLLDFGISKGGKTHTHQAMSGASIQAFSLHYASIEQIEGKGTDARSDLYSLGVTLHHLLTKQQPPQTVSRASAKLMNKPDPLRPANELNPQVPVEVVQVLERALHFDPNQRPHSASAMRQMLKKATHQRQVPISGASPTSPTPSIATIVLSPPPVGQPSWLPTPRQAWLPWGIVMVVVLLFGILVGTYMTGGGGNEVTSEPEELAPTEIAVAAPATVTRRPTTPDNLQEDLQVIFDACEDTWACQ